MDREALTPMMRKTWMPVCQRRMQLMCVGLLLSLTERFCLWLMCLFFFLLESFVAHTLHLSINFCSWWKSVIYYTQPCCSVCFASLWNVHLYLHRSDPVFCTCIYILGAHAILFSTTKTFDFFGRNPLVGQILRVHTTKAVCYFASNGVHVLHYWSSIVNDVVQWVVVSVSCSVLSKNSDVYECDLESCLQHRRRESLRIRQDVKLRDESVSPWPA